MNDPKRIIYVSAHPADRYLYMDKIVEALAELDGYEMQYTSTPRDGGVDLPPETAFLVVVATEKYFTWQNSGFQSEFLAAEDRGVRVLPLLMEPHVMNLLNMRCSKRQFIDATESLSFALDSLVAYISAEGRDFTFVEGIPDVFVSYRKRDIDYCRELVRIIDEYPGRGEFNLWYDKVINPGENYSEAIRKAIIECDLFILLVTHAVLDGNNYVVREEYPLARALGKKVIAVEAEKTDRVALAEKFPGIGKCVSIKQAGAIYSRLQKIRDK